MEKNAYTLTNETKWLIDKRNKNEKIIVSLHKMGNFARCVIACLWCESVRLQLVQVISTLLNLNEH